MDYIKIEIDNRRIKLQDIYECFWLQYGGINMVEKYRSLFRLLFFL